MAGILSVRVTTYKLRNLQDNLRYGPYRAQDDPNLLTPIIRSFGQDTRDNFKYESWPGGLADWARLSEMTKDKREERGYDRDGPILHQSGQLRKLSSEPFMRWRRGQKSTGPTTATAPYENSGSLTVQGHIYNGEFVAEISGSRVANQTAKRYSGRGANRRGVPPRPFWSARQEIIDRAMPQTIDEFWRAFWKRS